MTRINERIEINGRRYFMGTNGHLKRTTSLHQDVWESVNGLVPSGYVIHHIDHNKENNSIENLILLTQKEHSRLHAAERSSNFPEYDTKCEYCGAEIHARASFTGPSNNKKYCSEKCKSSANRILGMKLKTCAICGKLFDSLPKVSKGRSSYAETCSKGCSCKLMSIRQKDRYQAKLAAKTCDEEAVV